LIEQLGLPKDDLFGDTVEQMAAAYDAQAAKVAWVPKPGQGPGGKRPGGARRSRST